ncbi:MAG: TIM barrel protein [Bacteroidia bacterium]|nr:TIM barrel protein [Bacteroidia bacterium]
MNRRNFVHQTLAGAAGIGLAGGAIGEAAAAPQPPAPGFKLKYAPHFGMFEHSAGKDETDQLKFMAERGFKALEDNGMMGRPVAQQEKIAKEMARLGIEMGVFVVNLDIAWMPSLTTGKAEVLDKWIKACQLAVETAKRVNAKWMTVVPGYFQRDLPMGIQTANVIEALRRGAEIFEPHGLVMVLEPLSDNADLFLRFSDQTYMICKAVNSPSCKILFDMYHMQRNEGNVIRNIDLTWDEIPYFQIGDNPGRKEPTSGEMNYLNIFRHIHAKGFTGILGMEHGNAQPGKAGEEALIQAYQASDAF